MTTEASAFDSDLALDLVRPVGLDRSNFSRRLRSIIGVRESLLNWVPEERMRYTRLGAIVLNTAVMAGFSLTIGLSGLVGAWWFWVLLPIGFFWGYLILTIDSWLISSTHGAVNAAKLKLLAPRLVISLLLGVIIAEPLVLWIFKPSIDAQIGEQHKTQVDDYEGRLKQCNPTDGSTVAADCGAFTLNVEGNPQPIAVEHASATSRLTQLSAAFETLNTKYGELEALARGECAGTAGTGLTGRAGEGPECDRNREIADRFYSDNELGRRQADLRTQQDKVTALATALSDAQRHYAAALTSAIESNVAEKTENLRNRGILDDLDALGQLAEENLEINIASWLLRALLVAVDCLPVLVKVLGGSSAYDALVAQQLEAAKRSFSRRLNLRESEESAEADVMGWRIDQGVRVERRAIDEADRAANVRREAEIAAEIDMLALRLENEEVAIGGNSG